MEASTIEQECYCPICSELKKEARTLSCGHSFCTLCLRSIPISVMIKSSLNCPQCNLPTYVTTGILSLPRALHLEEPIRKLKLQNILKSNQPQPLLYQFQTSQEQSSLPQDQPQSHQENKNSYSYYDQPTQPYHPISIPAPSNTSNAQTVKSPKEKNFFQNFINLDMLKLPAFMSANPTPAPAPAPAPFQPPAPIPTISEEPKPVPPPSNDPIQDSEPLPPAPVVQTEPPVHQMEQAAQPAQEASNNNQQGEAGQGGFFSSIASSIAKSFESVKKTVLMEEDITSSASGKTQQVVYFAPFKVQSDVANKKMIEWINSLWFKPSDFSQSCSPSQLLPGFVPYYVFNADSFTRFRTITRPPPPAAPKELIGEHKKSYTNILLCASARERGKAYEPFAAGFDPAAAKIPIDSVAFNFEKAREWTEVWDEHVKAVIGVYEEECCSRYAQQLAGIVNISHVICDVGFSDVRVKLVYLPIYECRYLYQKSKHFIAINGQSGKVIGSRPVSTVGKLFGL